MRRHVDDALEYDADFGVRRVRVRRAGGYGRRPRTRHAGRCRTANRARKPSLAAERENLNGTPRRTEFLHDERPTRSEWDQADAFGLEQFPQRRRHHPAIPRPPVDRHHAGVRSFPGFDLSDFVQHLVGDRIRQLAGSPHPPRDRPEQHDRLQFVAAQQIEDMADTVDFRRIDVVELLGSQRFDATIREYARAVDDGGNRPEFHFYLMDEVRDRTTGRDIHGEVNDLRPRRFDSRQRLANLALRDDFGELLVDELRRRVGPEVVDDRFLESRFVDDAGRPCEFGASRCGRAPGEDERTFIGVCERDGGLGRDAACAAGNQHDILRPERERLCRHPPHGASEFERTSVRGGNADFDRAAAEDFFDDGGGRARRFVGDVCGHDVDGFARDFGPFVLERFDQARESPRRGVGGRCDVAEAEEAIEPRDGDDDCRRALAGDLPQPRPCRLHPLERQTVQRHRVRDRRRSNKDQPRKSARRFHRADRHPRDESRLITHRRELVCDLAGERLFLGDEPDFAAFQQRDRRAIRTEIHVHELENAPLDGIVRVTRFRAIGARWDRRRVRPVLTRRRRFRGFRW